MDDILGLVTFLGVCVAIFLAVRRVKGKQAHAVATAHVEGIEAGKAAVLADIGASVVVHNHNGDRTSISAGVHDHHDQHDHHDNAGGVSDHDRLTARLIAGLHRGDGDIRDAIRGADPRVALGVPVGNHRNHDYGNVRALRHAELTGDDAHRVILADLRDHHDCAAVEAALGEPCGCDGRPS